MADKVIYGIEFTSPRTQQRTTSMAMYVDRNRAVAALRLIPEAREAVILEFQLDEENWS